MSNIFFPALKGLSWSVQFTPMFNTIVQEAVSGREVRSPLQQWPRHEILLTYSYLHDDPANKNWLYAGATELEILKGFFLARQGAFDDFLLNLTNVTQNAKDSVVNINTQNQALYSQDWTNAVWTKGGSTTITGGATTAPDGSSTGTNIHQTSLSTVVMSAAQTLVSIAGPLTFSIWAKPNANSTIALSLSNATDGTFASSFFDLTTGIVQSTSAGTATITAYPNGWFRCTVTGTATVNNSTITVGSGAAVRNYSLYIWGAQAELSSTASSVYVVTTSVITSYPGAFIAIGDGSTTTFQLTRPVGPYYEPIQNPQANTVAIYVNGTPKTLGTDYTISNGLITFTSAPAASSWITSNFTFFYRCRFNTQEAGSKRSQGSTDPQFDNFLYSLYQLKQVSLVTVKL